MSETSADAATAQGPVRWDEGGTASVTSAKDTELVLRSSVPYPPGKPAKGTLESASGPLAFTVKVARSQLVAEGAWSVRARLVTATTALREAFARAATG
jgi:hypothetical protein